MLGQKQLAPKVARQYGIPLVFYGENEAEYGNPQADAGAATRSAAFYAADSEACVLSGVPVKELRDRYALSLADLMAYLPADPRTLKGIAVHYLGYYLRWTPQENYYYAVQHTGFEANPTRTAGTYSKYNSLDDRIDGLHYYTTYIKYGLGRASYDASQEIRNRHLTREEGVRLVRRFDGEFPPLQDFHDVMEAIEMEPERFLDLCERFRSPHLWTDEDGAWRLRHPVWEHAGG